MSGPFFDGKINWVRLFSRVFLLFGTEFPEEYQRIDARNTDHRKNDPRNHGHIAKY